MLATNQASWIMNSMSTPITSPEITRTLSELPIFDQWTETVAEVGQAVAAHPTGGLSNQFDRYNNDHLNGQYALNAALETENQYRNELKRTVAEGVNGNLDALASTAVLYSVDLFKVKPDSSPCRTVAADPSCECIVGRGTVHRQIERRPVNPASTEGVLELAETIDGITRTPRQLIGDSGLNRIIITEYFTDPARKSWLSGKYKLDDAEERTTTITTSAQFEAEAVAPVPEPVVDPKTSIIVYAAPTGLMITADFTQEHHVGKKARQDIDSNLSPLASRDRTTGEIYHMVIPNVAAMLAMGRYNEADFYYRPAHVYGSYSHHMEIVINGNLLPNTP
jgi:hypothetical protein